MMLRDCMLYAGIRSSRKFARLSWFQRDFFYGLLNVAWPAGRFESDVGLLQAALYAPLLSKVSKRDVQVALAECHRIGLVKLWTDEGGRGWGEVVNYRQHGLKKRQQTTSAPSPGGSDPPDDQTGDLFAAIERIERKKEIPPDPPAERGDDELSSHVRKKRMPRTAARQHALKRALQAESSELRTELDDLLRPGGISYPVEPKPGTPRAERAAAVRARLAALKREIGELSEP